MRAQPLRSTASFVCTVPRSVNDFEHRVPVSCGRNLAERFGQVRRCVRMPPIRQPRGRQEYIRPMDRQEPEALLREFNGQARTLLWKRWIEDHVPVRVWIFDACERLDLNERPELLDGAHHNA